MAGMSRAPQAAALALVLSACGGISDAEAVRLVEEYNRVVTEAYRAGNVRGLEAVAGPAEAKKVAALVGVKLDMGITLDAEIVDFQATGVERRGDAVVVSTAERWYYADRRVGTGEQVGQDSTDRYRMRYHLRRDQGRWVVSEIEHAAPPVIGRREEAPRVPAAVFHGGWSPGAPAPAGETAAGTDGGAR